MSDVTIEVRHKGRLIYKEGEGEPIVSAGERDKADVYCAVVRALGAITGFGAPLEPQPEATKRPQLRLVS